MGTGDPLNLFWFGLPAMGSKPKKRALSLLHLSVTGFNLEVLTLSFLTAGVRCLHSPWFP